MRITCPNCQAQYDVDPSMIPEAGRDVQCSSCAHTWFQAKMADAPDDIEERVAAPVTEEMAPSGMEPHESDSEAAPQSDTSENGEDMPEEVEAEPTPGQTDAASEDAEPSEERDGETDAETASASADETGDDTATQTSGLEDDDTDAGDRLRAAIDRPKESAPVAGAGDSESFREDVREAVANPAAHAIEPEPETKAELTRDVADILREEAEFEATRRRDDEAPPVVDPQGDLALDEDRPSDVLKTRLDRMRGDGVPEPTIASAVAAASVPLPDAPRRERLPDIEEINSSLRPGDGIEEPELPMSAAEITATRRSGFRTGFATVVLLTGVAIAAYIYAPQIAQAVPAAEPAMISYVDIANAARDRIDGMMAAAIAGINGAVGGGQNGA